MTTRLDPVLHRVDAARATGREFVLSPDHDGRILAGRADGTGLLTTIVAF